MWAKVLPFVLALLFWVPQQEGWCQAERGYGSFRSWLEGVKKEAISRGISAPTVERAFKNLAPIPKVIELDRSQPEVKLTLDEYLARVVTETRIATGRQKLAQHRGLLEEVRDIYGTPPEIMVALWGIESDYGRLPGTFPVIGSVATLAYDGRRSSYFRKELLFALMILDQGHISLAEMTGSWAGAMGHFQFMPSTFVDYALDANGDGRKDIWHDFKDALFSAAHYLRAMGWRRNLPWGTEVRLPEGFDPSQIGPNQKRPVRGWASMGVRKLDNGPLETHWEGDTWIVCPQFPRGRAFLVTESYRAIYRWNPSNSFAVAVGVLSDKIGAKN
jgi:membrane-bound lytic murein transglycosylase B